MRLLVDTHALIWWWTGNLRRLSSNATAILADRKNTIIMSVATTWEIAAKHRLGKLPEVEDPPKFLPLMVERDMLEVVQISNAHAMLAGGFKSSHGDPFDRILAAQAIIEQVPILSIDDQLDQLGCQRIWR